MQLCLTRRVTQSSFPDLSSRDVGIYNLYSRTNTYFLTNIFNLKDSYFKCVYLEKPDILGYGVMKQDLVGQGGGKEELECLSYKACFPLCAVYIILFFVIS